MAKKKKTAKKKKAAKKVKKVAKKRCEAKTKDGKRCKRIVTGRARFCSVHKGGR